MCVIFLATDKRPTPSMIDRAYDTNGSGAGIAWRQPSEGGGLVVKWVKGLKREDIQKLALEAPLPFVCHFRIPTCGGAIPELTHPFPIAKNTNLALEGTTKGFVLFHNGHWGRWKDESLGAALKHKLTIPAGKWSDSRAMAWTAAHFGVNVLEFIDEKCIAFGPRDVEIYGSGWSKEEDVWCSNKSWVGGSYGYDRGHHTYRSPICKFGSCKVDKKAGSEYCPEHQDKDPNFKPVIDLKVTGPNGKPGGASHHPTFSGSQGSLRRGEALTEEVQAGSQALGEGNKEGHSSPEGGEDEVASSTFPQDSRSREPEDPRAAQRRWACSLNPKPYRSHRVAVLLPHEIKEDELDRERRKANLRAGITLLGPM